MKAITTMLTALTITTLGCAKEEAPPSAAPKAAASPSSVVTASPLPTQAESPSADPLMATATPLPDEAPTSDPDAADSAAPPVRRYDCGAKGQKPCPMQAWMKRVMGPASSNRDAPKLAEALTHVTQRVPPGYSGSGRRTRAGRTRHRDEAHRRFPVPDLHAILTVRSIVNQPPSCCVAEADEIRSLRRPARVDDAFRVSPPVHQDAIEGTSDGHAIIHAPQLEDAVSRERSSACSDRGLAAPIPNAAPGIRQDSRLALIFRAAAR